MDSLGKSIRHYAQSLAEALRQRRHGGQDYPDEPLPRLQRNNRAARARVLALLAGEPIILEDVTAVTVIRDGKRVYVGEARPRLCEAYSFDAVLLFDDTVIDYAPRDLTEISFKHAWCTSNDLQYFPPGSLGDLGTKLHISRRVR